MYFRKSFYILETKNLKLLLYYILLYHPILSFQTFLSKKIYISRKLQEIEEFFQKTLFLKRGT